MRTFFAYWVLEAFGLLWALDFYHHHLVMVVFPFRYLSGCLREDKENRIVEFLIAFALHGSLTQSVYYFAPGCSLDWLCIASHRVVIISRVRAPVPTLALTNYLNHTTSSTQICPKPEFEWLRDAAE